MSELEKEKRKKKKPFWKWFLIVAIALVLLPSVVDFYNYLKRQQTGTEILTGHRYSLFDMAKRQIWLLFAPKIEYAQEPRDLALKDSPYKTYASGYQLSPSLDNSPIYWIDDDHVIFSGNSMKNKSQDQNIYIWNVGKEITIYRTNASILCFADGILFALIFPYHLMLFFKYINFKSFDVFWWNAHAQNAVKWNRFEFILFGTPLLALVLSTPWISFAIPALIMKWYHLQNSYLYLFILAILMPLVLAYLSRVCFMTIIIYLYRVYKGSAWNKKTEPTYRKT